MITTAFHQLGTLSDRVDDPARASRSFAADRDGFVVAEGSGVLVLERPQDAEARGRRSCADLVGVGLTSDAHHPRRTAEERKPRWPVAVGRRPRQRPRHLHAEERRGRDGRHRTGAAARPERHVGQGRARPHPRAAGAVEAALTALPLRHGVVPPIANLASTGFPLDCVVGAERAQAVRVAASHSFGFGGHNVVLVFSA